MEENILNYSPTFMFHGTSCIYDSLPYIYMYEGGGGTIFHLIISVLTLIFRSQIWSSMGGGEDHPDAPPFSFSFAAENPLRLKSKKGILIKPQSFCSVWTCRKFCCLLKAEFGIHIAGYVTICWNWNQFNTLLRIY